MTIRSAVDSILNPAPLPKAPDPLTLADWLSRELPPVDPVLGAWMTTTSRALIVSPTGLGKTLLSLGMTMAVAAGRDFLHWRCPSPRRCLYVDGEMSRRLLKTRLCDEVNRIADRPDGLHVLSHEDVDGWAPLNTPEGQGLIEVTIAAIGGVDFILFDNIMSLIAGDQKDEEGWRQTMPWIRSLTARNIGQTWIHHTGHDETRSYGSKTREWQMDTVIHLEKVERPDTDVCFDFIFRKARERTPDNRADFATARIALVNDAWTWEAADGGPRGAVSPLGQKFFEALTARCQSKLNGRHAASLAEWRAESIARGLVETGDERRDHTARTLFAKYKRELIAANRIACDEQMAWVL